MSHHHAEEVSKRGSDQREKLPCANAGEAESDAPGVKCPRLKVALPSRSIGTSHAIAALRAS
jgi:hypothetical protein